MHFPLVRMIVSEEESAPVEVPAPAEPQGPPPAKPGSDEWIYVEEPIDAVSRRSHFTPKPSFVQEIAAILSHYYDAVESNYIDISKVVFRNIRFERSHLIDHFYATKVNFKIFLDRPDTKQEYVDVFVKVTHRSSTREGPSR